jgi:hypothetical protein
LVLGYIFDPEAPLRLQVNSKKKKRYNGGKASDTRNANKNTETKTILACFTVLYYMNNRYRYAGKTKNHFYDM